MPEKQAAKKPPGKRKKRMTEDGELPGISLEKTVARIQQMLDPNSTVTHNEKLEDRVGNTRQFDVVIRGQFGGRPVLGIMECRDHSRKKGPDAVEGFAQKCDNLGANLRMIVSKKGFTRQALKLAKHEHIGCLSLLPHDPQQAGFSIGGWWYGVVDRWTTVRVAVDLEDPQVAVSVIDLNSDQVIWRGLRVIDWFERELYTTYREETKKGSLHLKVTFSEVRRLEINGTQHPVVALTFSATSVYGKKRRWVNWSGDAFYDWHANEFTIPNKGQLIGSPLPADLAEWDDYDGEIPNPATVRSPLTWGIMVDAPTWDDTTPVPDLTQL